MAEGQERPKIVKLVQPRAQFKFSCGREAVRIVDQRHSHESTHLATEANTKVQELSRFGLSELDSYRASLFCTFLYRHRIGSGEHRLTNAGTLRF